MNAARQTAKGIADDIGAVEYAAVPPPALVLLTASGSGSFHVHALAPTGFNYSFQHAPTPLGPWTTFTNASPDFTGSADCDDANPSGILSSVLHRPDLPGRLKESVALAFNYFTGCQFHWLSDLLQSRRDDRRIAPRQGPCAGRSPE